MKRLDTEVLIAGGGAVGLALALDLGWRGHNVIVVDEGDGHLEHPRTGAISIRTMEHCRRWGIADQVRGNRFPPDYKLDVVFCTSLTGYELARADSPSMADTPVPAESPERKVRCPQFWFDPMLSEAARGYDGVSVHYRTHLDRFEADAGGVVGYAHGVDSGEEYQIRARYLVGSDGPASGVRTELGIGMTGNPVLSYSVNILFHAPKLLSCTDTADAERYIMVDPDGTWGNITVVDGRALWRLTVTGSEQKLDLKSFDPAAHVRRAIGADDVDFEVRSVSPWRRTQLVADQYRDGNVLLAGDAVHTMSPTGGFGVNTGIGDAVDLGWKLDALLGGWGGTHLLDSYGAERRPIGVRNAAAATQNFRGWSLPDKAALLMEDSPRGAAQRAEAGRRLLAATHAEWESIGVILGYRYEDSPICVPDGTPPPPDEFAVYVPVARPGSRAPHCWLPDGRSTLDLFGRGFVVVHSAGSRGDAVRVADQGRRRGVPVSIVEVPDEVVTAYEAPLVLVRPDGHVCWRASSLPENVTGVIEMVRGAKAP